MTRWKITLEYHGGGFVGWQRQASGMAVQQALEEAILRYSGETAPVQGAGRTDAGVHALGQVAHFDLARAADAEQIRAALNYHLRPHPAMVLHAEPVTADFDARFSARQRRYLYRILNRPAPPALDRGRVWHCWRPLNADAMHEAAQALVGRHDFTSFRASLCQANSPLRTLDELTVIKAGEEIHITAAARSFLHHQVRNMVGTLALVGEGKWTRDDVTAALNARDRSKAGPTAPADGLYFVRVAY